MILKEWAKWRNRKRLSFDSPKELNIFRSIMNHLVNYRYYKNRKYGLDNPYQSTEQELENLERTHSAYRKRKNLEKRQSK